ncbi:pseudouridine synthase [Fusobacterium gastrosuis]|uniref:pseudouridine synthase n=1 Tax=Fusobacterium gastrosuis TaxID=1755100 RepID=UPI00297252B7|nr:pseudouridine synthase [Fusobacteriaceae bacterium]MDY5712822.1 pseudouridine synthase [Fusobacterium gastrosuis]
MRLDKFLVECGLGSRKEVKEIISNGEITVNGEVTIINKQNIDEASDEIRFQDEILTYKKYRYYIMNKKAGYITATEDFKERTVMELLPDWVIKKDLAPVGRLDKDTEGLLLFTNDGKLNHKLLSPKSHVDKTYYVEVENDLRTEDLISLENGVTIDDYFTMPAQAKKIEDKKLLLTIREGKFHQVKKMLEAVGNKVLYLKRISFGKLKLNNLELGEVKEVSLEDIV